MKNWLFLLAMCVAVWGCAPAEEGTGGGADVDIEETDNNVTMTEIELPAEGLTLVKVSVPGMTCAEGCPPVVKSTLASCDGVENVDVDFDAKVATVSVTADKFDSTAAINALADIGFKDSTITN